MRGPLFTISVGVALFLLAAVVTLIASSWWLWLLWHMLPGEAHSTRIAVVSNLMPAGLVQATTGISDDTVRRLAWEDTARGRSIVVLPRLLQQRAALAALRQAGYTVERRGLLLRGYAGEGSTPAAWPSPATLLARLSKSLVLTPEPLLPVVIAAAGEAQGLVSPGTTVVGAQQQQAVHGLLRQSGLHEKSPEVDAHTLAVADGLLLDVPSAFLSGLPPAQINVWEEALHARLGFTLTQPKFIEALTSFEGMTIYLADEAAGVAISGDPARFEQLGRQWAEEEERRTRPQARAFRLPDGTVGHEQVPGNPASVFRTARRNGCLEPIAGKTTLWICQDDEIGGQAGARAALATSEDSARTVLSPPAQPLTILLTGQWLEQAKEQLGCAQDPRATLCTATRWQLSGTADRLQLVAGRF